MYIFHHQKENLKTFPDVFYASELSSIRDIIYNFHVIEKKRPSLKCRFVNIDCIFFLILVEIGILTKIRNSATESKTTLCEPTMLQVKLIRFSGREVGNVAHDADQEARKFIRAEGNEEIFNGNKN
jgi:hypothetical protein